MAIQRQNPLGRQFVGSIPRGHEFDDFVKQLTLKIEEADRARVDWLNKQLRLFKLRRGVRNPKTIPWPGANNDTVPIIDETIRRWKPGMANLVLRQDPVALFRTNKTGDPEMVEYFVDKARRSQAYYHWLFTNKTNCEREVLELADHIGQFGTAYTRQGWNYKTEREVRIARVSSFFPSGVEAAYRNFVETQLPEGEEAPPPEEFIQQVFASEYGLDPQDPEDEAVLYNAAQNVMLGAPNVKISFRRIVADEPVFRAIPPTDVIVPQSSENVSDADFICILHRVDHEDVRRMSLDGWLDPEATSELLEKEKRNITQNDQGFTSTPWGQISLQDLWDKLDGVSRDYRQHQDSQSILWEIYTKKDIDGDGVAERIVIWHAPASKITLNAYEYPLPLQRWPVSEFRFEWTSKRPYSSRGIAEMLEPFQKQASSMHNARLDAAQIVLSPATKVRMMGNDHLRRNIRLRPGAVIPLRDTKDLEPIIHDIRGLNEFFKEEQIAKSRAEQYVGIFDPSLSQLGGSGRERRTATEIDAVTAQSTEVQGIDAMAFQVSMADVHKQLWALWLEFGPEETYFRVTGSEQPQLIRKQDIAEDYDIIPAGSPTSTNRALVLARARDLLQLALSDQTGLINKRQAYMEWVGAQDIGMVERLVREEEQAALLLQMQGLLKNAGVEPAPTP